MKNKFYGVLLLAGSMGILAMRSLLPVFAGEAKSNQNDCLQQLRNFYRSVQAVSKEKTWHLRYTMDVQSRSDNSSKNYPVEMIFTAQKMQMKSEELEMYQDEKNSITVLPKEKKLYIADRKALNAEQQQLQAYNLLRDTLIFSLCEVKECRSIHLSDGKDANEITLAFKSDMRNRIQRYYPIESITLTYQPQEERLYTYTTRYSMQYPLSSITVTFHTIDYQYSTTALEGTALSRFFLTEKKVRPSYQSYSIIDVRKKNARKHTTPTKR